MCKFSKTAGLIEKKLLLKLASVMLSLIISAYNWSSHSGIYFEKRRILANALVASSIHALDTCNYSTSMCIPIHFSQCLYLIQILFVFILLSSNTYPLISLFVVVEFLSDRMSVWLMISFTPHLSLMSSKKGGR